MRSLAPWIGLAAVVACTACGPSLRRAHRSQVYFERCYSADLDPAVPVDERRACWQQWMAHYHEGQPPDRTDYARERIVRLDPERAEILALATGGGDADPEPEIAAEAEVVAETVAGAPDIDVESPAVGELDAIDAGVGDQTGTIDPAGAEPTAVAARTPVGSGTASLATEARDPGASAASATAPEVRAPIPSAAARRAARAVVAPRTDAPHCAAHCEPRWTECSSACTQGDRFACLRACRLQHRTCSRGCY